jgi:ribosomal protein L10
VVALLDYRGLRAGELKRIRRLLDQAKAGKGQKGGS